MTKPNSGAVPRRSAGSRRNCARTAPRGTPDEVVAKIESYRELGITRMYLQTLDLDDLDHLELVASKVIPQLG